MYLDDLPIWAIVGEMSEDKTEYFIWTHRYPLFLRKMSFDLLILLRTFGQIFSPVDLNFTYKKHSAVASL